MLLLLLQRFFAAVGWLEFELANQHKSYRKLSIHLFSHMKQEKVLYCLLDMGVQHSVYSEMLDKERH